MKVVINRCYGGFSVSEEVYKELGIEWDGYGYLTDTEFDVHDEKNRTNPRFVAAIEKLGEAANGRCARLKVVEVPDDVEWYIDDYDGVESVCEVHRRWY